MKSYRTIIMLFVTMACCFVLAGCMVGPDYIRPDTAADDKGGFFYTGKHEMDVNDIGRWWERFADTTTTELVETMLENNYDLKAAAARVVQAEAVLTQSSGKRLPQVAASFDRTMTRTDSAAPGAVSTTAGVSKTRTYSPKFTVSYVTDLFGKLRRSERADYADVLAAKAVQRSVVNTMVATVINSRIQIATLQKRLAIARANTESRRKTLAIIERRYGQGLVGPIDVRLGRENLAASQATESALELSLIEARNALDVMLGARPGSSRPLPETLADLPDLEPVPVGLPASLLDRRPDVIAAEMAIKAANERVGVSIAQLYPDLTLSADFGWRSFKSDEVFVNEAWMYSTLLNLAAPIYKGGQLRAQVAGAKGRYEELAADYSSVVLNALREVEDALAGEQLLVVWLGYVESQLTEAMAAEELSRRRYGRGVERILTVLESERRRRIAENELAILKGRIWTRRVNLFLALGGDFVND